MWLLAATLEQSKETAKIALAPMLDLFSPDYLTKRTGGQGAFREFIDKIIKAKKY